jgi:hypothetical protein
MRALAIIVALTTTVAAYPMLAPLRTEAQRAAIAQAFRARNREHWLTVEVDPRGFVNHVITDDPGLVPSPQWTASDLERIRSFLRGNVDFTGIGPRVIADLEQAGLLLYGVRGARLAKISLERNLDSGQPTLEIRAAFEIVGAPAITPEQAAARVAGARVRELDSYGKVRTMFTRTRSLVLRAAEIRTTSVVHADGDRVRVVFCSEPHVDALPADPSWGDVGLLAQQLEPAILGVVDAISGEALPTSARNCDALGNVRN